MAKLNKKMANGGIPDTGRKKACRKPLSFRIAAFLLLKWLGIIAEQRWHNVSVLKRHFGEAGRGGNDNAGYIIVANHVTNLDPLLVANLLYHQSIMPHFLAKASLFKIPVLGHLMRSIQQIPVERGTKHAAEALKSAQRILAQGDTIVIYPEGTHTQDPEGWPMRGRPGAVKLALDSGAVVIPLAHYGAQKSATRRWWRWRKTVNIIVGDPLDLSSYRGRDLASSELRQAADCMMTEIKRLQALLRPEDTPSERLWNPSSQGGALQRGLPRSKGGQ